MKYAPIVLFVYNRPEHTARTVEALRRNELAEKSELHIFSDGPKNSDDRNQVSAVRAYLEKITGFERVFLNAGEVNAGLANSIIAGVTEVCGRYGSVIVLEDDLVTSPYFLRYMNDALETYAEDTRVGAISGNLYPLEVDLPETYFIRHANSWGWGTWQRAWKLFNPDARALLRELERLGADYEFDFYGSYPYMETLRKQTAGEADSWAIRWYATLFLRNMLSLYPRQSLTCHIGDQSGTHCRNMIGKLHEVAVSGTPVQVKRQAAIENPVHRRIFAEYYGVGRKKIAMAELRRRHSASVSGSRKEKYT
ncbi:MAG: glycosyltransferase [Desulfovibrio sp.]|nr:glycosyltransferase [Desulfovibrio sp.]